MGRQLYLPDNAKKYLENLAATKGNVIGLTLGEIPYNSENVINVVHLTRTPEDKTESSSSSESVGSGQDSKLSLKSISESWVADHAKHVTRMLPGGLFVLGVFVVSPSDVFSDNVLSNKLKYMINYINKLLSANKYMHGCPEHSNERIVIHMSSGTNQITAKTVEIGDASFFKPAALSNRKYSPVWLEFECYYEFDEFYPVVVKNTGISVKEQCQIILNSAYKSIESSVVLFDGSLRVSSDTLESQFKKKIQNRRNSNEEDFPAIQVSIMVPCESNVPDNVEYIECEGTTHFSGIIASRVYLISKLTVEEAINSIKQDIMRSLAARFTMHCDALIDDKLLPEEKVCFNEPPRRVYIKIPQSADSKILLCDYLFPGETPIEALVSVKEMLDIDISEDDVISNVETPADTSEFDALEIDPSSEELLTTPQDRNKITFPMGVGISVIVGLISVLIYYYTTILGAKAS